jgi:hypothetical protein
MDPWGDFYYLDCRVNQDHEIEFPPPRLARLEILLFYLNLLIWFKGMHISV